MKIGEVARRAEVTASAIRFYESAGLLSPPRRESGRRVYDDAIVAQLQAITALQSVGFRLAEIRELMVVFVERRPPERRWQEAARAKLSELDKTIADLRRARRVLGQAIDCACGEDGSPCALVAGARASRSADGTHRNRQRRRRPK